MPVPVAMHNPRPTFTTRLQPPALFLLPLACHQKGDGTPQPCSPMERRCSLGAMTMLMAQPFLRPCFTIPLPEPLLLPAAWHPPWHGTPLLCSSTARFWSRGAMNGPPVMPFHQPSFTTPLLEPLLLRAI